MNTSSFLLAAARALSGFFRPQYFPVAGFVVLFQCTYLALLPLAFKALVLLLIVLGTLFLPRLTIRFWRHMNGFSLLHLRRQRHRYFPYLVHILYYAFTLHILHRFHLPAYMSGILVASLLIQVTCAFVNLRWKISMHCAAAGGVVGALVAYSFLFAFDPTTWLCLAILLCGLVGSSRMLLRQHTLGQVLAGTLLGIAGGVTGILMP